MENPASTFEVEDAFHFNGRRGLILIGEVDGQVSTGNKLLFPNGTCWLIKSVEAVNIHNQQGKIGLLVDAPTVSPPELTASGIIGNTAQVLNH